MELYYVLVQNTPPPPRLVPCERVAAAGGFWLYSYDPKYDIYIDEVLLKDLGQLKLLITKRYGWLEETFLVRRFEEVANLFVLRAYPRVIYLTPRERFCTRLGDTLLYADLKGDNIKNVKKWWLDGEEPKTVSEALEKLSGYAQKHDKWIIFKHRAGYATAYEAYPSP